MFSKMNLYHCIIVLLLKYSQVYLRRNSEGRLDPKGTIWAAPYRWGSVVVAYKKNKFQKHNLAPIEVICFPGCKWLQYSISCGQRMISYSLVSYGLFWMWFITFVLKRTSDNWLHSARINGHNWAVSWFVLTRCSTLIITSFDVYHFRDSANICFHFGQMKNKKVA